MAWSVLKGQLVVSTVARRGPVSLSVCLRWLPAWLPKIYLASLMDGARIWEDIVCLPPLTTPTASPRSHVARGCRHRTFISRPPVTSRFLPQPRIGSWVGVARPGDGVAFLPPAGQIGVVAADQLEMISTDPRVMHGHPVIAGTRVRVSVILDCLAADMTAEEITAEYPAVTVAGVRAAAYGAARAHEELLPLPQSR